jgi:hypothetical protein
MGNTSQQACGEKMLNLGRELEIYQSTGIELEVAVCSEAEESKFGQHRD